MAIVPIARARDVEHYPRTKSRIFDYLFARNLMPIDISTEQVLSLTAATKSLPGRPHVSTLWRWYKRGVRGIQLETIVVAGRRFTSAEAIQRFAERCSAAADGTPSPIRTSRQREAALRAAEVDCERLRHLTAIRHGSAFHPCAKRGDRRNGTPCVKGLQSRHANNRTGDPRNAKRTHRSSKVLFANQELSNVQITKKKTSYAIVEIPVEAKKKTFIRRNTSRRRSHNSKLRHAGVLQSEVVFLELDDLTPSPENDDIYRPVDPNSPDIQELADSIRQHGVMEPLVVSADGRIISGHRRYVAAQLAGLTSVPCRVLAISSDDEQFVLVLANTIASARKLPTNACVRKLCR